MNSTEQKLDELFQQHPDVTDPPSLKDVRSTIKQDLKPVRQISSPLVFAMSFMVISVAIAVVSVFVIPSLGWNALLPLEKVSVFVTLAASASLLAFSLSLQMFPGSHIYWTPGLIVTGISVLTIIVLAAFFQVRVEPRFLRSGLICVRAGAPYGLPAALLFVLLLRRGLLLSPARAGLIAGMLAGLVSMAVLEIHCPNFNLLHIVMWHFGIPLVGAGAGCLLGLVADLIPFSSMPPS